MTPREYENFQTPIYKIRRTSDKLSSIKTNTTIKF